ncbi:type II secretion system F family protein [Brevibacillus migulae]|uniref:type II secretion system F family protein n=1 Tax=Brevibacillus migulae TaxID=1644114 RepID=UPI00106DE3E6|nr:type II secretion system F family protein [Brevibacillus migulae]
MGISVMIAAAVLLYLYPSFLSAKNNGQAALFGRIEVEQQGHYKHAFRKNERNWPGLERLRQDPSLSNKLAGYVGLNMKKTEEMLQRLRWQICVEELLLAKLVGGIVLLLTLGFSIFFVHSDGGLGIKQLSPAGIALVLFLLPTWLIESADKQAKEEIRQQVPIFFGIVQALVEAGLPVHTAVRSAARRFSGRLGQELVQLEVEEKRYGNWRKALEEMAYRWEIDSLVSIVLEINGAITKGVSIAAALATQVEELLKQQEDEAADRMNRMSVRLLPLLIVFMGVPLLFLVLGPAFIGMKEAF